MSGAGELAAVAAYRVGSGYVTLASNAEHVKIPELLTTRPEDESLWGERRRWSAAAIGPGFGVSPETASLMRRLLNLGESRIVVDADAITVAAQERLFPMPPTWILTPHAGELSRILDVDAADIEADRFRYAREAALKTGAIVLLKGFRTLVSDGTNTNVIASGNPALAKAGTGDALTGMITGLLAQGLEPIDAASLGAYLHGRLADEWVKGGNSALSLVASDLAKDLPALLGRLARRGRVD
jgi:NAD(P)H-hydrate epimerase